MISAFGSSFSVLTALVGLLNGLLVVPAQDMLAACDDQTKSAADDFLKVVMSDVVRQHTCSRTDTTFENMMERCEAFCAPGGIPIPVGTSTTGFNLDQIDDICMGRMANGTDPIVRYDRELLANCVQWSEAVQRINLRAADFIASVTNMTFEQLVYRAAMADKVYEMQEIMTSDEVQEQLDLARADRKLERLQEIIGDSLADLMQDGLLSMGLRERLVNLDRKAQLLMDTIDASLPELNRFTEECNDVLLATGPANEYMLDICSVTSDECIESEHGRHVGCCCGIIPAVGSFDISASTGSSQRRLQEDGPLELAEQVDVCGKAAEVGARDLQSTVSRLTEIPGGAEVLEAYDAQQRDAYPGYYDSCDARRLDTSGSSGIKKPKDFRASRGLPKIEEGKVSSSDEYAWMTSQQKRNLQSYLTCNPPSSPTNADVTGIDVEFWDHTEQALCKNIEEPGIGEMSNDRLAELCAGFCSPDSIPLLLGTTSFGFSQAQMDEVCLRPDPAGDLYDAETINRCHLDASIFTRLQDTTAAFAQKLQILDASRLRFQAYARTAQEALKTTILENAETTVDNERADLKLAALEGLIRTGLSDIIGGNSARSQLLRDAREVNETAFELRAELAQAIPGLESFLENCNFLTTGVGPSSEYMLDMCSQTSMECIESEQGRHVGCCCGYNPIIKLGTEGVARDVPTILGRGAEIFSQTPATASGGAPSPPAISAVIDICAKAYVDAKPTIDEYYADISNQNQEQLYLVAEQQKRERYTDYYERCEPPEERWTWSAAARAQVDSFRSMFSSSPAVRLRPVDARLFASLLFCSVFLIGS